MDYQASKYQKNRDPFAESPLQKPFYYPSPTKEVDEHEAICSPGWNRRKPLQENFLPDSLKLSTSAQPHIQALDSHGHDLTSIADCNLDETWPSSVKSSISFVKNDSDISSASQAHHVSSAQNGIGDIVKNLGNFTKSRTAKENTDFSNDGTAESVLKRYIERFRYSDPKPREERLKERDKTKQEFWWLKSSQGSNGSETHDAPKEKWTSDKKSNVKVLPESQTKTQLTKEALMVLDEETMKLQLKADRLLSQSESSLTSGPIVSTDGLGSSVSGGSELSCAESQPPYQPAFLKKPIEKRSESSPPVLPYRPSVNQTSNHPADDILLRWRLNRKFGSSGFPPTSSGLAGVPGLKATKTLDPRLEEFRRRLLSQKALITKEEIDFERQRMAFLLDDEGPEIKKPSECSNEIPVQVASIPAQVASDPILERMSKITNHVMPPIVSSTPATVYNVLQASRDQNANFSNAGLRLDSDISKNQLHLDTKENKNNTASSGVLSTGGQRSSSGDLADVSVDHFVSQIVCDPKDKKILLHPGNMVSGGGDAIKSVQIKSAQFSNDRFNQIHVGKERVNESGDSVLSVVKDKGVEKNAIEGNVTNQKQSGKHEAHIYHQYLEAEKPIAESKETDRNLDSGERVCLKIPSSRDRQPEITRSEEDSEIPDDSRRDEKINHKINFKESRNGKNSNKEVNPENSDVSGRHGDNSETFHHALKNTTQKKAELQLLENSEREKNKRTGGIKKLKTVSEHHSTVSPHRSEHHSTVSPHRSEHHSTVSPHRSEHHSTVSPHRSVHHSEDDGLSLHINHPVQAAIGQTVREQMFVGRSLFSSVDSWASMFSESPAPAQSLCDSHLTSPSHMRAETLQSTPINKPPTSSSGLDESDGFQSDGEFSDDPLLLMLREQRNHFLRQLELVEMKLQEMT
ncbi:hypothetical protein Btru_031693 [Bulinus truncatus]|nr:hypothetical protein Btru_031693 [Bulinus truncatus]